MSAQKAPLPSGLSMLLKTMGVDPAEITTGIGQVVGAAQKISASSEETEKRLSAIERRLETIEKAQIKILEILSPEP